MKQKKGSQVAIKIEPKPGEGKAYGRHFDHNDLLYAKVTRASLDAIKEFFRSELTPELVDLLHKLKKLYNID